MGKYFNSQIKDMPSSEIRRLNKDVKVSENRIYGQTTGFLEAGRKAYNEESGSVAAVVTQETPLDLLRKQRVENLVKAREAKRVKAERTAEQIIADTVNVDKKRQTRKAYQSPGTLPEVNNG
ncbi:hypothetical protein LCGC14_0527330 [marine sediment metagenome]|uniref:Uncharacterized protein n=1 Tax=marine sediment metagenome TaxID=412755 RepID=A0A0F9SF03_9ZZZZ